MRYTYRKEVYKRAQKKDCPTSSILFCFESAKVRTACYGCTIDCDCTADYGCIIRPISIRKGHIVYFFSIAVRLN